MNPKHRFVYFGLGIIAGNIYRLPDINFIHTPIGSIGISTIVVATVMVIIDKVLIKRTKRTSTATEQQDDYPNGGD
jgi:hypothetical protein